MTARRTALVLAAGLALVLAACSPDAVVEGVVENQTGVDVETDEDGNVTITDKEGGATISGDGETTTVTDGDGNTFTAGSGLPDGFPGDVPLLDLEIAFSMSESTAEGTSYSVSMSGKGGKVLYDEAIAALASAGYSEREASVTEADGTVFASATYTGPHTVTLAVIGDAAETIVTYTIEVD